MAVEEIILRYKGDISQLKTKLGELKGELVEVQKVTDDTGKSFGDLGKALGKGAAFFGVATGIKEATRALIQFTSESIQLAGSLDDGYIRAQKELNEEIRKFKISVGTNFLPAAKSTIRALADLVQAGDKLLDVFNPLVNLLTIMPTSLELVSFGLRSVGLATRDATIDTKEFSAETDILFEKIVKFAKEQERIAKEAERRRQREAQRRQKERDAIAQEDEKSLEDEAERIERQIEFKAEAERRLAEEVAETQAEFDEQQAERSDAQNVAFFENLEEQREHLKRFEEFQAELDQKRIDSNLAVGEAIVGTLSTVFGKSVAAQKAFFVFQKLFDIARIIIDTQRSIFALNVGAAPFLANPLTTAAATALIAAHTARIKIQGAIAGAIVAATAVPQFQAIGDEPGFAKGVIKLKGKGTRTSDSILARLSKGESVMTADETDQHHGALMAMRRRKFDDYILADYLPKLANKNTDFATRLASALGYNQTGDTDKLLRQGNRIANRNADKLVKAIMHNSKKRGW